MIVNDWHFAIVDQMCISDYQTVIALSENFCESANRNDLTFYDVIKHIPSSNARQLIFVANQYKLALPWQRFAQTAHQRSVNH